MNWEDIDNDPRARDPVYPEPDRNERGIAFSKGISARELMTKKFPPIKYVVPGYLVEGLTVFAGAPKLGKSWACLGIAVAVASGGCAFGSVRCQEGDVLYLALEDNQRRLQDRLRQMCISQLPERLTLITEWPDLDGECLRELEHWLQGTPDARLIIVDVFVKVRGAKGRQENQYEADYKAMSGLQELAIRYGVAILAVHHTRKMDAEDPFDAVSGTRGQTGAADSVWVMRREPGSQRPVLYGRGRDLHEFETAMEFDRETGAWRALGDASKLAKTEERQEILEVLGRSVDPLTPTEIGNKLGKTQSNVSHMLSKLYDEGKVEKVTKGKYRLISPLHSIHSTHSENEQSEQSDRGTHRETSLRHAPQDCPDFDPAITLAPGECYCDDVPGWN